MHEVERDLVAIVADLIQQRDGLVRVVASLRAERARLLAAQRDADTLLIMADGAMAEARRQRSDAVRMVAAALAVLTGRVEL